MTSLSTVGFGDRNAKADLERVFCVIIFVFGTAIFSYIQTLFLEFTDSITKMQAGPEQDEDLLGFFDLLRCNNNGVPVNVEF